MRQRAVEQEKAIVGVAFDLPKWDTRMHAPAIPRLPRSCREGVVPTEQGPNL